MLKKNFIAAINKLKERNQKLVNKNGITPYTRDTDIIINNLVKYYNHKENDTSYKDLFEKARILAMLFGCNIDEYISYDQQYLECELFRNNMKEIFVLPESYIETEFRLNQIYINTCIRTMVDAVKDYRYWITKKDSTKEIALNLENLWPELHEYFKTDMPINEVEKDIKLRYYAARKLNT